MREQCQSNLHFVNAGKFTIQDRRHYIRSHYLLKHTYTIIIIIIIIISKVFWWYISNNDWQNANNGELVQVWKLCFNTLYIIYKCKLEH